MSRLNECPICGNEMTKGKCNCGFTAKDHYTRPLDKCVMCNSTKDLNPVGIKRNGENIVTWYCEPHYLKRIENMSKTSEDLSWCKADPKKAPNPDVVKVIVKDGDIKALLKSLF